MITDDYLDRLAFIESSNDPFAVNENSGAKGLYQFMPTTARQYGLDDPFDPDASREAVKSFTNDNYNFLRRKLNRDPTNGELYLAHQQGMNGSAALLANPKKKAVDVLAEVYGSKSKAKLAIKQNGGDIDMTAGDFAQKWIGKFEEGLKTNNSRPKNAPYTEIRNAEGEVIMSMGAYPLKIAQGLTEEEKAELAALEADLAQPEQPQPRQRTVAENIGRTAERGGRSAAAGLASAADFVSDIGKLPFQGFMAYQEALDKVSGEKGKYTNNPVYNLVAEPTRKATFGPGIRESVLGNIDAATNNNLKPENFIESMTDFGVEIAAPAGILGRLQKTKGVASDVVQSVLDPLETGAQSVMKNRPTSDFMRKMASGYYSQASKSGGELRPVVTDRFITKIENILPKTDIGRQMAGEGEAAKQFKILKGLDGKPMTLEMVQDIDEALGDMIDSHVELGRLTKEGRKLFEMQTSLRDVIKEASKADFKGDRAGFDALNTGRNLWAKSARMRDIEKIIIRGENAKNPNIVIKNGFRTLLANDSRMRGFTKAEREAIKRAAETGIITDVLDTMGSKLNSILTFATGHPVAAGTTYVGSSLARKGASKRQLSRAYDVMDAISGYKPPPPEPFLGSSGNLGVLSTINTAKQRNEEKR